ncbi:hypothetical protein [Streptomyces sp. NPDC052036]|uniref:hypothetical protein n=1 Tax=Streptomyces sp. NPDC052036 TaxID=3155171 RepID=UPI003423C6A6
MRRTFLSVAVALLAAGCVTVRHDSGDRQAAAADAHAPAPIVPRPSAPRPPRGTAALVRTGSVSRPWLAPSSPAGLRSSSQERRPVPAQRSVVPDARRLGAPREQPTSQVRAGRRPAAAPTPHQVPYAPGHATSARPAAAHGLAIPSRQGTDPFAVCGLVEDMGLTQAAAVVC